ncbi:hypothetical protein QJQ45_017934 [Haematococcus lacustris]|nr:hypothetical protein QJQ45_017934 [Haematococcus lacustris]
MAAKHPSQQPTITNKSLAAQPTHNQAAQVSPEVAHNQAAQVSPEVAHNQAAQVSPELLQQSRGSHITPMRTDLHHMGMTATKHMTPQPSTLVRDKAYVCLHPTNSVLALCSRHGPITHCNLR